MRGRVVGMADTVWNVFLGATSVSVGPPWETLLLLGPLSLQPQNRNTWRLSSAVAGARNKLIEQGSLPRTLTAFGQNEYHVFLI